MPEIKQSLGNQAKAELPKFCEGVEYYPDEPYLSLSDALVKTTGVYSDRSARQHFESMDTDLIDASLYWLERCEKHYQGKPDTLDKLQPVRSLLTELKEEVSDGRHQEIGNTTAKLRVAREELGKVFQVDAAVLTNQTAMPLIRMAFGGKLNPKIVDIVQQPMVSEKIGALVKLVSDHESGAVAEEQFIRDVEALFADELK